MNFLCMVSFLCSRLVVIQHSVILLYIRNRIEIQFLKRKKYWIWLTIESALWLAAKRIEWHESWCWWWRIRRYFVYWISLKTCYRIRAKIYKKIQKICKNVNTCIYFLNRGTTCLMFLMTLENVTISSVYIQ